MSSKFRELAKAIRGDRENLDQQADELFKEREELRVEGERVMAVYRDHHKDVREGLKTMREAIADLKNDGEGSDDLSGQGKGDGS